MIDPKKIEEFEKILTLKSEVVKFGVAQDVINFVNKAYGIDDNFEKLSSEFDKIEKQLVDTRKKMSAISEDAKPIIDVLESSLEKIESQAKELGIKPTDINAYKEGKDALNRIKLIPKQFSEYSKGV